MDFDFSKLYGCDESEDWLTCMEEDPSSDVATEDIQVPKLFNTELSGETYTEVNYGLQTSGVDDNEEFYPYSYEEEKPEFIKVAMYLQTCNHVNYFALKSAFRAVKKSDADILVFPETCYIPFYSYISCKSVFNDKDREYIFKKCLEFSRELGRAVVISTEDDQAIPYSVFANARANTDKGEQACVLYAKHTMASNSAFDAPDYEKFVERAFEVVNFRGFRIGMTICYDCNHAAFSRMYGMQGVDLLLNSTGGNVVYSKWYRYNQVRAIENNCYSLVTMGNNGFSMNGISCVYGFNANGGELDAVNLCGPSNVKDNPGGIYVYKVSHKSGAGTEEKKVNLKETVNKNSRFSLPVGNVKKVLEAAIKIKENLYCIKADGKSVILCIVDDEDIFKPEKTLSLLYDKALKPYKQRRYIIVNRFHNLDNKTFMEKLSPVLRVRSMENFCAVVLESNKINKCYQCGKSRSSQLVKATDGEFLIDLSRTTGPEAIWTNKTGMKAKWREGYEYLVKIMDGRK